MEYYIILIVWKVSASKYIFSLVNFYCVSECISEKKKASALATLKAIEIVKKTAQREGLSKEEILQTVSIICKGTLGMYLVLQRGNSYLNLTFKG